MKKYFSMVLIIVALILIILSLNLPWWNQSAEMKKNEYKINESYGLTEYHILQERLEDQYQYSCPSCGQTFAYDNADLEDEKDYVCPECGDYIADDLESLEDRERYVCPKCGDSLGYSSASLEDLEEYCPECGNYVGSDATECTGWGSCGATFSKPSAWCSECDDAVTPIKGVYCYDCGKAIDPVFSYSCWDCDEVFQNPDKEQSAGKGDIVDMSAPYSNYQLSNPKKEDGVENKINVSNMTFYLMLITLIFSILAIASYALYHRKRGKFSGKASLPMVFTLIFFIFILITPIYYAAGWGGAIDDDFDDKVDGMYDEEFGAVPKPKQVISGFFGSKSTNDTAIGFSYMVYSPEEKVDYSWSPAIGWFLAIIAMVLVLISFVLIVIQRRRSKPKYYGAPGSLPPPGAPPSQMPYQQMQTQQSSTGQPTQAETPRPPPPPPPPPPSYDQGYSDPSRRNDRGQPYDFSATRTQERRQDYDFQQSSSQQYYDPSPPRQQPQQQQYYDSSPPKQQPQQQYYEQYSDRGQYSDRPYPPRRTQQGYYDPYQR